jgi:hypothetical protein
MASRPAPAPASPEAVRRLGVAGRANVPPFHVMDVLAAAAQRRHTHGDLLDLVAGQPSTPAPRPVREAARRALDGVLGYTVATGFPSSGRRSRTTTGAVTGSRWLPRTSW